MSTCLFAGTSCRCRGLCSRWVNVHLAWHYHSITPRYTNRTLRFCWGCVKWSDIQLKLSYVLVRSTTLKKECSYSLHHNQLRHSCVSNGERARDSWFTQTSTLEPTGSYRGLTIVMRTQNKTTSKNNPTPTTWLRVCFSKSHSFTKQTKTAEVMMSEHNLETTPAWTSWLF